MPAPNTAGLDTARTAYQASPGAMQNYSDEAFIQWWANNTSADLEQFPQDFALLAALADSGNPAATQAMTAAGFQNAPNTGAVPIEQGILTTALPGLVNQVTGDANRQQQVTNLTNQTNAAFGNLNNVLGNAAMTFNGTEYLRQNPDVAAAYATDGAGMSVDDYAKRHYETYGRNEGRAPTFTSEVNRAQVGNVDATVTAVINASKTGAAATKAALDTMTAAQLANVATSLATKQQALQQQVTDLQGNATAAANARRQALEQQIAQLTAAQKGVSESRVRAAENEVTGINLGLEGTRDQLAADAAREGFVGPSSMSEAALGRAAIDARQGAARSLGGARVANAMDDRAIGTYGANQGYNITDIWAGDTQRAGDMGAAGRGALTAWGADQGRGVNDAGATGTFNIASNLANQTRDATIAGAGQKSNYFDQLFPNALNAAQIKTGLPAAQAAALTSLIPYGTAGTRDALGVLNWWSNPTGAPPTSTAAITQPSTQGNAISGLGANLVGAGFQYGSGADWWKTPKKPAPTGTATFTPSPTGGGPYD